MVAAGVAAIRSEPFAGWAEMRRIE